MSWAWHINREAHSCKTQKKAVCYNGIAQNPEQKCWKYHTKKTQQKYIQNESQFTHKKKVVIRT